MISKNDTTKFPRWLLLLGYVLLAGSGALAGRLIWEQTVWTWARGPQMVGFSLAHGGGALLLLIPVLLILWFLSAFILIVRYLIKRRKIARSTWAVLGGAVIVLILLLLPYSFWQRLFVSRLAVGPYAGEFLTYAAATGDLNTVKALLEYGVSIDIRNREGKTGLHTAAVEGQNRVIEFLISKGANVNAIDRYGDTPLEKAISAKHNEAAKLLADKGGQRIRDDEQTRQKATEDIVREDIQNMEKKLK